MEKVVVLSTPPVEIVGESVDLLKLFLGERGDTAEVVLVDQPVLPLVDSHSHVLGRVGRTSV